MPAGLGQLAIRCLCFKFPRGETGSWLKWGSRVPCHAMPCLYSGTYFTCVLYILYYLVICIHMDNISMIYIILYTHYICWLYIYIHNTCANLCFYLHLKPRYDSLQGIPLSVGSWFGGPRLLIDVEPQSVQGEPRLWLDLVWANNLVEPVGPGSPWKFLRFFLCPPKIPEEFGVRN